MNDARPMQVNITGEPVHEIAGHSLSLMAACRRVAETEPAVAADHVLTEAASIATQALIASMDPLQAGEIAHGVICQTAYQIAMRCGGDQRALAAWRQNLLRAFDKGWAAGLLDDNGPREIL